MNRIVIACISTAFLTVGITYAILKPAVADGAIGLPPGSLHGFTVKEIRFDESMGNKAPDPQIPSSWKFMGVSNGEHANSNNIWFQDSAGTIFMVQGFDDGGQFILEKQVGVLNVGR